MSKRKAKAKWKADTKRWQVDVRKGGIRRSFYSTISAADAEILLNAAHAAVAELDRLFRADLAARMRQTVLT